MSTTVTPGLEDVTVTETSLSRIDGEAGELVVRGIPIGDLARNATYEETVYLLLHGRLPTAEERAELRAALATRREIGDAVRSVLQRAAREENPAIDALRMGVAAATLNDDVHDSMAEARRLIAVLPTIVAAHWRYRQGDDPVAPRDDLRHAANFLYMLTEKDPSAAEVAGLETYLNTVAEHGLNASTFTARVVVSTESDLVSAATAAVGTLKGPLHGGAPGPVLEMLRDVYQTGDADGYVQETLADGERLMGFGYRVYRVRDPRAAVLEAAADRVYADADDADFLETAKEFEDVARDCLAEHVPNRRLETNVEFYTALVLAGIGIPRELFTATFASARVAGWIAHALEQLEDNRLVRPTARYVGDSQQSWTPIEHR